MALITANQLAVGLFNIAAGGYAAEATANIAANEKLAANSYINLSASGLNPQIGGVNLYNNVEFAAGLVARLMSGASGPLATSLTNFVVSYINANPSKGRGEVAIEMIKAVVDISPSDVVLGAAAAPFQAKLAIANASTSTSKHLGELSAIVNLGASSGSIINFTTVAGETLLGTVNADIFNARILDNQNTAQSGDKIAGGAGIDRMNLDIGNSQNFSITLESTGVEQVAVRAQAIGIDSSNNNISNGGLSKTTILAQNASTLDAQRMSGVTQWESNNSRADVIIEDVRIDAGAPTKSVIIAMVETDPGNVDFAVYFNQLSLRNASSGTASINIFLMDTAAANAPATAATPLLNNNFNSYTFYANNVKVVLGGEFTPAGTAIDEAKTYAELKSAFELALKTAKTGPTGVVQDLSGAVAVSLSAPVNFTTEALKAAESATVAASFLNLTGQILTLTTNTATAISSTSPGQPNGGWRSDGPAPSTGAIVQTFNSGSSSSSEVVTGTIILDDVGMGSTGGDLVVGGMSVGETSDSRGVERFEIIVRDNSKLQTINGTNNALREVTIVNGDTDNVNRTTGTSTTDSAYRVVTKNAGDLTVNGNANFQTTGTGTVRGTGSDTILKGVNNSNSQLNGYAADHHGAFGFSDVRLIDASTMAGNLAFTAQITTDSIAKYITRVDFAANPFADVAGTGNNNFNVAGANFVYTGGNGNDTMAVTIDGNAAGSRSSIVSGQSDFTFVVDGGAGNDAITVNLIGGGNVGGLQNWANNQDLNNNIIINGGAGNDTIRKPGAGDTIINAGDGNDTVYSDNTGRQTVADLNGSVGITTATTLTNGRYVFNTLDQNSAFVGANGPRNLIDLRSDVNNGYNFYKGTVTVAFKGIAAQAITLANAVTYRTTDLEINQAIKEAINKSDSVLSKLLIAQDGPGNTLVVTSLIDGVRTAAELTVTFAVAPATTVYTAAEIAGMAAAYGVAGVGLNTNALALAAQQSPGVLRPADYTTAFAQDSAGVNIVGAASTSTSDNFITPGANDDVIVLGTTVGASLAESSNEVITYGAGFGNDTVVNFAVAGNGIDHLNFAAFLTGAIAQTATAAFVPAPAVTVGALGNVDNRVTVVAADVTNSTDALVSALVRAAIDTAVQTAITKQVFVTLSNNVGTVFSVVNGVGIGDAVVTREGTIGLADTPWGSLTAVNYLGVSATAEGASTAGFVAAPPVVVPPIAGFNTIVVTAAPAAGSAAADNFTFDANPAPLGAPKTDAAGTNFQTTINGFTATGAAADRFTFDFATANPAITTLAQLNGQQGVSVQPDPFANATLINFGPDANGGQIVTITLAGIVDATTVAISVI